jgi:sulfur carrier protein
MSTPETTIQIMVNGLSKTMPGGISIAKLLDRLGIPVPGTAVELAGEIVPAKDYDHRLLEDGQKVEIVRMVGGG